MGKNCHNGFTLTELLIAVAISAVLIGLAWPAFETALKDTALRSLLDEPRLAFFTARSEAIKSSSKVTVCPRASSSQCGTDWNEGLLVFIDGTIVPGETKAVRSNTDPVLRTTDPQDSDNELVVYASDDRTVTGLFTPNFIRFGSDGRPNWKNGTVLACDSRGSAHAIAINVSITGDVRGARVSNATGNVRDAFGREVSCS